ncbi:MAG: DUF1189 family protein [Elusimicrobiaceae bacterium]|nr:DUF1189 family protein [Elusimicrobiaceae bacterium]
MILVHLKTLFSFRFYHFLAQLKARYAVGFVLYLFAISVLIFYFFTGSVLKTHLPIFLKNFPQVTFEKGVLTNPQQAVAAPISGTDFQIVFDAAAQTPPSVQELMTNHTLAWVHKNQIYIPSANGLQTQTIPANVSFTSTPQTLEKYQGTLQTSLRVAAFVSSLFLIAFILVMDYCLALAVVLCFHIFRHIFLPKTMLLKYAAFLLGPLTTLWIVRLWVNIPLFSIAQLILCIIYTQQIFNSIPGSSHEN